MEIKEPLIDEINKLTNNEYNFALKSATLDEGADFCVIEFLYKDGKIIDKTIKDKLCQHILNLLPKKFKYDITFIKNYVSEERIEQNVSEFLKKEFASLAFCVKSVKKLNNKFEIDVAIDNISFEYAMQKNVKSKLENYLKSLNQEYDFVVNVDKDKVFVIDEKQEMINSYKEEIVDVSALRKIDFYDVVKLVNDEVVPPASYIVDKKTPDDNVTICGKIKFFKSVIIKRKPKNVDDGSQTTNEIDEQQTENATQSSTDTNLDENVEISEPKYERKLFKWVLEDITSTIPCVIMSNKENQATIEKLKDGLVIAVHGKTEVDKFSGDVVMRVHDISLCQIPEDIKEYIAYKKEKPFYEFIEPEQIVVYHQDDLLSFAEEKKVPEFLQGKTFVCYDLETTGLHFDHGDRMVEIGSVKIVDGKITEKFVSYVNPNGKKIDPKASETTGIYDEDVANAPKDYQVLQDFYKFTRGAIIIGYNNINFDNLFLIGQGKMCKYNFDNQTEDVFRYAQKYVQGVKNYKLGTIAEKLGVTLDNAHSAFYDAMATAEIFLKLAELIKN